MSKVRERARRIKAIRIVRKRWVNSFFWRNHLTASHEFQLLDVLRDIRGVLTLIAIILFILAMRT